MENTFKILETHFYAGSRRLISRLVYDLKDHIYVYFVFPTDDPFPLKFYFGQKCHISLLRSILVHPHSSDFYNRHIPYGLFTYQSALKSRPFYEKLSK